MDSINTVTFNRDDWWDRNGAFRLLHDVNPLRLRLLLQQVGALQDKRLLDVGCGGGIFAEAAAREGALVCGLDSSFVAIATAQRHAAAQGLAINYQHKTIAAMSQQQYDVITCFEMLEHVDEPANIVADIAERLAPGGFAVFSTINRTVRAWGVMIALLEYTTKVIPHGTHDYNHFIPPAELARFCRHNALRIKDVCGMQYSFFGHYYRLNAHDTSVNYFLVAQRGV